MTIYSVTQSVTPDLLDPATDVQSGDHILLARGEAVFRVPPVLIRADTAPAVYVTEFGALPNATAAVNTAAFQDAIDFVAGQGGGEVVVPEGDFALGLSLDETVYYVNAGTSRAPSASTQGACIVVKSGVFLKGAGEEVTILRSNDKDTSVLWVASPESGCVSDMTLDSSWVNTDSEIHGHGIYTVDTSDGVSGESVFKNFRFENLLIKNVAGYGIGIQGQHDIENVTISNVRTDYTGLDGIDTKFRGPNMTHKGAVMDHVVVERSGRRAGASTSQCGIDVRGPWKMANIYVRNFANAAGPANPAGVRFRQYQTSAGNGPGNQAERASMVNFEIISVNSNDDRCVDIGSSNVIIGHGTTTAGARGVNVFAGADGAPAGVVVGPVIASDATEHGFFVNSTIENAVLIGCISEDCDTGFRNNGTSTALVGCAARGSITAAIAGFTASRETETQVACVFDNDAFVSLNDFEGAARIQAQGGADDINLRLVPKGTGLVQFGARTASSDVAITGYITILDSAGVSRKLAIIA